MFSRRRFLQGSAVSVGLAMCPAVPSLAASGPAGVDCLVVRDATSDRTIFRDGPCDQRFSPCSTFKLPLALMGFDAGLLTDPTHPSIDYAGQFPAPQRDHKQVDPTIWLRDSVVWYSRVLTQRMGMARFQAYVDALNYGNRDLGGNPGRNDGLTNSWLMSSLAISPDEQVAFLANLLKGRVAVSAQAQALTLASMPRIALGDGWVVVGKTGGGWHRRADGTDDEGRAQGWFVGWAEKADQKILFARLHTTARKLDDPVGPGPAARKLLLDALPQYLPG